MEDKIEVNEYVRTKDGRIAQIKSIDYEAGIYRFDRIIYINDFSMKNDVLYNNEMFKKLIVKHNKIISEVVNVGDYVNGKLIHKIDKGPNYCYLCYGNCKTFVDYQIQTILTKEQFEANCYKVGGEDER
nr:MAG TPA: hypothetical protein [Caudoviricetes sp.]